MGDVDSNIAKISFSADDSAFDSILGVVEMICYVVAVILVMMKGIQFLQAAPDGKAKIKEELTRVFIGSSFLVSTGAIIDFIRGLTSEVSAKDTDVVLSKVLGAAQVLCYVAAVILIMWMGIKWLTTAPEGKAEIKKGLIIAAIGAALLVGAGTIMKAVGGSAGDMIPSYTQHKPRGPQSVWEYKQ